MPNREIKITIYRISGKQLFFNVDPAYCRECDMTVNVVERALGELAGVRAKLEVKPWINYLAVSIFRGGYHPPVLLVDGKIISQGVVPTREEVKKAILQAWDKKSKISDRLDHRHQETE